MAGRTLVAFLMNERGIETVEYAVATTLIVAAMVAAFVAVATAITGRFAETTALIN